MGIPIVQIDAFTDRPFAGNPAAVCLLPEERPEAWMQSVAAEMNLSETAFLVWRGEEFGLRWFTPAVEVELCGHATLASAHYLWESAHLAPGQTARFRTKSGLLTAVLKDGMIELDFPATPTEACEAPRGLLEALGTSAVYTGKTRFDYLVELESEEAVRNLRPDFSALRKAPVRGVIVTARGGQSGYDFVSRFFAPGSGIDEDPVTGSAHCCLGPFWKAKLGQDEFRAFQASARGGEVNVRVAGDRVKLGGHAVTVMRGEIV
jgi:PhzF family phenazine biosynthesis protein